jgi:hypothetical protein
MGKQHTAKYATVVKHVESMIWVSRSPSFAIVSFLRCNRYVPFSLLAAGLDIQRPDPDFVAFYGPRLVTLICFYGLAIPELRAKCVFIDFNFCILL